MTEQEIFDWVFDQLVFYKKPPVICPIYVKPNLTPLGRFSYINVEGFGSQYIELKFWRGTREDESVLAHELTHYIQWYNGRPMVDKIDKYELEAREIEKKWLKSG